VEPVAGDTSTDIFIFLILLCEARVMKETCELEIFEVLSIDSLC
jgi:hypothetical protein